MFIATAATGEAALEHKGHGIWRATVLLLCPIVTAVSGFAYAVMTNDGNAAGAAAAADPLAQPQFYAIVALAIISSIYIIPVKLAKAREVVAKRK
jgi:hypothetical protein